MQTVPQHNQSSRGKCHFVEEYQLKIEVIIYLSVPKELMNLSNNNQWLLSQKEDKRIFIPEGSI